MDQVIKISVITPTYNCIHEVERTIQSVLSQTYSPIEYIVIDGGSNDGTKEIISRYGSELSYWVSERDNGIYDAMNKGIEVSTGDYVIFINAGDVLRTPFVFDKVMNAPSMRRLRPKIISGRIQFELDGKPLNLFRPRKPGPQGIGLPHQATFVELGLQKNNLFDIRYRFVGDYELWRRLQKRDQFSVKYVDEVVSFFKLGGASNAIQNDTMRYLERAYVDYLYSGKFGHSQWTVYFAKVVARRISFKLLGQRTFFRLLHLSRWDG